MKKKGDSIPILGDSGQGPHFRKWLWTITIVCQITKIDISKVICVIFKIRIKRESDVTMYSKFFFASSFM